MIDYEIYPVDFAALEKGDTLGAEDLLVVFNRQVVEGEVVRTSPAVESVESDAFRFQALELMKQIRRARPDLSAHVRSDRHGIRIMTDSEAEEWGWKQAQQSVRTINTVANRRAAIDYGHLGQTQRAVAETRDRNLTALAFSARKEMAKAEREARLLAAKEAD